MSRALLAPIFQQSYFDGTATDSCSQTSKQSSSHPVTTEVTTNRSLDAVSTLYKYSRHILYDVIPVCHYCVSFTIDSCEQDDSCGHFSTRTRLLLFDQAWKHMLIFEYQKVFFWLMFKPLAQYDAGNTL